MATSHTWYTPAGLYTPDELAARKAGTTDKLARRTLRFIDYGIRRYVEHREKGEYLLAVARLQRLRKLIVLFDQTNQAEIAPLDRANVTLLERHIHAMLPDQ